MSRQDYEFLAALFADMAVLGLTPEDRAELFCKEALQRDPNFSPEKFLKYFNKCVRLEL